MTFNVRLSLAAIMLVFVTACSKVPEEIVSEDTNLTEEQQIDTSAQTLEEAAEKAMQIEIDSLNNVEPEPIPDDGNPKKEDDVAEKGE